MARTIITTARDATGPASRLMASAITMLHLHAYHSIGVQMLCDEAEVSKGSFYHFFPSKEGLMLAAINDAWESFHQRVLDPALAADPSPSAVNAQVLKACLGSNSHPPNAQDAPHACMFTRLAASVGPTEPRLRDRLGAIFSEWARLLGGGKNGRQTLASIQGALVIAMVSGKQGGGGSE